MRFDEAIVSGFRNYLGFSGRAPRSEYWYWYLFTFLVGLVTLFLDSVLVPDNDLSPFNLIASLALLLPSIAMGFRRLHDIDRTAWWVLLAFTIIGAILLIVWACIKGTDGPNRFGPDPLGPQ
jgi:uncharacterized membrane protein YhaH (DUF805 family)